MLRVAMPYPDQGIPGAHRHHDSSGQIPEAALMDWVADSLDTGGVEYDCSLVEIVDVPVDPTSHPSGLAAVLGEIMKPQSPSRFRVRIVCVVAEIGIRRAPRAVYPTQWPGKIRLDDGRIMPEE